MSDTYHMMKDSVINDKNQKEALSKYFMYQSEKQEVITKAHQEKCNWNFNLKPNNRI